MMVWVWFADSGQIAVIDGNHWFYSLAVLKLHVLQGVIHTYMQKFGKEEWAEVVAKQCERHFGSYCKYFNVANSSLTDNEICLIILKKFLFDKKADKRFLTALSKQWNHTVVKEYFSNRVPNWLFLQLIE